MSNNPWKYLGLISQVGMTIVIAILISTVLGVYLDGLLGTTIIFTFLFIFLGAASGLWAAYQLLMKISIDDLDQK